MNAVNGYHRQVCRWLDELGQRYQEEHPCGPYHLDIYLPDLALAVEVDGPLHNKRQDAERDATVAAEHNIRTVRVPVGMTKTKALEAIFAGFNPDD